MSKYNICLVQPKNYIHSLAFLELGELIFFSLKELKFETSIGFNRIDPNFINIIIGCHLLHPDLIQQVPKNSIVLNTEQIYSDTTKWNQNIFFWAKNFTIWDYSKKNIEKFNELGLSKVRFFGIGFQQELARLNPLIPKDIDVLFYGSINQRRKKILEELEKNGLKVKVLFGVYGKERDNLIERSKIVLNFHYYNSQIFEVVRVFYLLTNSIAVVGEVNTTTSITETYKKAIFARKYEELVSGCLEITKDDILRRKIEMAGIEIISQNPQINFTKDLINS